MTTRITTDNITDGTITGTDIDTIANGAVNWQAVTVADGSTQLTAEAGKGYFLDTNAGVIEVFFPASPSRGDTIVIADYAGHFALNNVIINTGSQNLDSTETREYKLTTNDTTAEFVYVDSAKGWLTRISQAVGTTPSGVFTGGLYDRDPGFTAATGGTVTTSGDFKIHTFTGDGCFVVSSVGSTFNCQGAPAEVDYVVVAGGGGGSADGSGGAGAGGFREAKTGDHGTYTASPLASSTGVTVTAGTFPITVGAGGAGSTGCKGLNGSNSIFSTITATGGGSGGGGSDSQGGDGGSGGGARTNSNFPNGGSGNTPPVSPAQGRDGGGNAPGNMRGGGGGGATAEGVDGPTGPMAGGAGATNHITGSPVARAGGGGGGFNGTPTDGGPGGAGGGGNGGGLGPGPAVAGDNGTANTGGGGGGSGGGNPGRSGGTGGKGVVIIRYKYQ